MPSVISERVASLRLADLPETVNVATVAKMTSAASSTVYDWIRNGELPVVRIGGRIRVRRDVLGALLAGGDPHAVAQKALEETGVQF